MKKIVKLTVAGLMVISMASVSFAAFESMNGLGHNSLTLNGGGTNGINLNGAGENGTSMNGLSLNSLAQQGLGKECSLIWID